MSNALLANFDTELPQKLFRGACPLGPTVDPVLRTQSAEATGSSNAPAATVPAGAQVGDLLVAIAGSGAAFSAVPAGWTSIANGGGTLSGAVAAKICTAADIGASAAFSTAPSSTSWNCQILVYYNYDQTPGRALTSIVTAAFLNAASTTITPTTPSAPTASKYVNVTTYWSTSASATVSSPPSGGTLITALTNDGQRAVVTYGKTDAAPTALTWSAGTAAAMSISIGGATSSQTSGGTVAYTVPANTRTKVTNMALTNTLTTGSLVVSVALGGTDLWENLSVSAGQTVEWSGEEVIAAGETIIGSATASGLNLHVSGRELV
jgi:hypothetical protein